MKTKGAPVRRSLRKRRHPEIECNSVNSPDMANPSLILLSSSNQISLEEDKQKQKPKDKKKKEVVDENKLDLMEANLNAVMRSIGWLTQTVMKSNCMAIQPSFPSQFEPSSSTVFQSPVQPATTTMPAEIEKIMNKLIPPFAELPTPTHELETPTHELPTPSHELQTPTHELPTPTNELTTPTHELPTPTNELPTPTHELPTPMCDPDAENPRSFVRKLFNPPRVMSSDLELSPIENSPKISEPLMIPPFLSKIFKAEHTSKLCYAEMAVATYVFKKTKKEDAAWKENMVKPNIPFADGNRGVLHSLMPKQNVTKDVINLLACMLTTRERSFAQNPGLWFFPTSISQAVLSWVPNPDSTKTFYQKHFMGKIDLLSKIFVPVNDDNKHWYLLVVDFHKEEVVYLDSFPEQSRMSTRIRHTKLLCIYLEELLVDDSFYTSSDTPKPIVSAFKVVVPEGVGAQGNDSNDSGVWVASWMNQMGGNGYKIKVDTFTRLKLGVDLVLHSQNLLQGQMLTKALTHYQRIVEAAKKKKKVPQTC